MTYFTTGVQLQAAIDALPNSKKGGFKAFDPFFYGQKYIVNGNYTGTLSPLEHFVQIGADLGNSPSAQFDPVYYKATYADLASSSLNAADLLYHFLMFGLDEGRAPNATLAGFNGAQYLANNADVAEYVNANLDQFGNNAQNGALAHYVKFGQFETRPGDVDSGMGGTFRLTVSDDIVDGTANNDTFKANVLQNPNGQQVNSLGSGDEISGGAGVDTLMAKVTAGAFVAGNYTMPIQPETTSVEIVKLEAVNSGIFVVPPTQTADNGTPGITDVYINAKDMSGVTQLWSSRSDANLVVQNMTTKGLNKLSDMTIGMEYTGNADSVWNESNMTVYFDQDYLTPEVSNAASVDIRLMNQSAYDSSKLTPLGINDSTGAIGPTVISAFTFTVGEKTYDLVGLLNTPANALITYADALAAIKGALIAIKLANPDDALLQTVEAKLEGTFFADIPNDPVSGLPIGPARVGETIILSATGTTKLTMNELLLSPVNQTQTSMNLFNESRDIDPSSDSTLAINVALEKVGLAGDGGTLIIGSMNKTSANEWNAVNTVTDITTSGINQFDVTVYGSQSESSSLAGLHSTNNNLRVVNVTTDAAQTGTFADLTIGNSNTPNGLGGVTQYENRSYEVIHPESDNQFALKDVQTFNAAGLKGDLTLFAALTDEVVDKYLNIVDFAPNAALDNENFVYTSGSGNDYINLFLDTANLEQAGTVAREDLTLTVNTGTGNDEVVVSTGDFSVTDGSGATPDFDNWYDNQHINANLQMASGLATGQLQINTGEGNDIVRTLGSGDYAINTGAGDDTVYADNTGDRSVWTINATTTSAPGNLQSLPAVAAAPKIANLSLTVSFLGLESKVNVGGSNGSISGVNITDLTINQAIKDAINNDAVLNKLLIAEDGPGRTLVITSLSDGVRSGLDDIQDVVISLSSTALTIGQSAAALLSNAQALALGFQPGSTALTFDPINSGRFDANDQGLGSDSAATSDNLIVGGEGNDVIVLGTGEYSNDTVGYAAPFGNDVVVNFDAGVTPASTSYNSTSFEVVSLAFSPSDGSPAAQTIIFDGVTVNLAAPTVGGVIPSLDVASQFVNQYNAAATNGWTATLGTATPVGLTAEVATLTALDAGAGLAIGDVYEVAGLTYTATAATSSAQLAAAFANLAAGATTGAGTATGTYGGTLTGYSTGAVTSLAGVNTVAFTSTVLGNVSPDLADSGTGAAAAAITVAQGTDAPGYGVTLTRDVPGAVANLTAADFTGTYFGAANGNGTVVPVVTTQGADNAVLGSPSTFTVTYDTATTAAVSGVGNDITFAGAAVDISQGDGALTVANKVAAGSYTGWTAGSVVEAPGGTSYSVTFTATTNAATPIATPAAFLVDAPSVGDNVFGSLVGTVGVANTTTPPVLTVVPAGPSNGADKFDFTSLNGDITTQTDLSFSAANGLINKSIIVAAVAPDAGVVGTAEVGETFNAAAVKLTFDNSVLEDTTATSHVFIAYNTANVASVYTIVDGTGANDSVVTLMGTIDLADTPWADLTVTSFV